MPEVLERCVKHVMDSGKSEDAAWPICINRLRDKYPSVEKWVHRKKKKSATRNHLIKIANQLDSKGLYEEANKIDRLVKRAGTWALPETVEQVDKLDMYLKLMTEGRVDLHDPGDVLMEILGDDMLFDDFLEIKDVALEDITDAILSRLEDIVNDYEDGLEEDQPAANFPVDALRTLIEKYSK